MAGRINRAIELLDQDQPIYYTGPHSGHVLTYEQGKKDAKTWADYINVGMEHGSFDMSGLAHYMRGLVDGGPTNSGHRTPAVIVEAPVNGIDASHVRYNAWQFRQILGRGVHGVLLCQAESADAVTAFVESCRYPINKACVNLSLPTAVERLGFGAIDFSGGAKAEPRPTPSPSRGEVSRRADGRPWLGLGTRGRGSEDTAAPIWGTDNTTYVEVADPWPLNRMGELLLGVKIESPEGVANCDEILAVPGLGFAEMGPGDLGLSLGYLRGAPRNPYPPEMQASHEIVFAACRRNGIAFLEGGTPETIAKLIDTGARVIAGGREDTARAGRAHSKRTMLV